MRFALAGSPASYRASLNLVAARLRCTTIRPFLVFCAKNSVAVCRAMLSAFIILMKCEVRKIIQKRGKHDIQVVFYLMGDLFGNTTQCFFHT
uniref:Uncharacterized protein n=1 Tax=Candidatus Kentrum sp. FM TaxID=2126340 RepID=A0A450WEP1_9GAMM|nr:MAG: hypothetical protein BECKFM1743C_GA0114222_103784 [Candidatus Kentron sp. FM]VFJ68708.1 MAG: hypothetical protein BECKFM1743A_GA0114220_104804 [Candidatus Kentron sp. FM]VFK15484.1 MAG: hypothetical protein BECKFM1743B_GA0114221_103732 [Candidatus Kentron sp. FM]